MPARRICAERSDRRSDRHRLIRYHRRRDSLIPSGSAEDREIRELRTRLGDFEAALAARSTEVAAAQTDLAALESDTARRSACCTTSSMSSNMRSQKPSSARSPSASRPKAPGRNPPPAHPKPETAPRFTSDAIRRLFRDVAKAIHPDLSRDSDARDRRHALMIEANRAYAQGDEQRLRTILQSWERSPKPSKASMPAPFD